MTSIERKALQHEESPKKKRKRWPANPVRSSSRRLPSEISVILLSHYMIEVLNLLRLYSMISALGVSRI